MSLIQPFENPKQGELVQYDNGSLERIFSFHIVQQTNGSANLKALDMPLIDMSSNEMFLNATSVEDCYNNNPKNLHATLLQTNFIVANRLNIKKELQEEEEEDLQAHKLDDQLAINESHQNYSSTESSINRSTENDISDSLSEYLIFHKKTNTTTDVPSKFGCYVKLQRLSESDINSVKVMCEGDRALKRPRLQSMYVPPVDRSVSRSRNTPRFEDVSNCRPENKQSTIKCKRTVKRTGKNSTIQLWSKGVDKFGTTSRVRRSRARIASYAHLTNQQSEDDEDDTGKPKIVLLFVRDKTASENFMCVRIPERFGVKQCSVQIERLPIPQFTAPYDPNRQSEYDQPSDLRRTNEVKSNSVVNNVEAFDLRGTNTNSEVLRLFDASTSVVSLLPDITKATWSLGEEPSPTVEQRDLADSFNDPVVPSQQTERDLPDNSNDSTVPSQQTVKTNSLFDDIEALEFTTGNVENSPTLDELIVEATHSISVQPPETNTNHANPLTNTTNVTVLPAYEENETAGPTVTETVPLDDISDDDNCSIASDISLFASDSDTLYSPERKKSLRPTDGWTLNKYRIPRKAPVCDQVDRILAMTIKDAPKMVSPIRDPPIQCSSKRKRKVCENERALQSTSMKTQPFKPKETIRKTGKQSNHQSSAVKSIGNTIPSQMGSDYNMKSKQKPNKMRASEGKSMESDKATTSNEFRDNGMLIAASMELEKPTGSAKQFNDFIEKDTLDGKSTEPEKLITTAEHFNHFLDNGMLGGKSMEPEKPTRTVKQFDDFSVQFFNDFGENGILERNSIEPKKPIKVMKQFGEFPGNGILEANTIELEELTKTSQTNALLSQAEPSRTNDTAEKASSEEVSEMNKSDSPTESNASSRVIAESITNRIDSTEPYDGRKFRSKFDLKNPEKIIINVGDPKRSRIVSIPNANATTVAHCVSSLPAAPVSCTDQIQSTPAQTHQASRIPSVPQPIDSIQNVVAHSQSMPEATLAPLHEMQSPIVQSTALLQPSTKQLSIAQAVSLAPEVNLVQGHLNQPDDWQNVELGQRYFNATLKLFENPCTNFLVGNGPCKMQGSCHYCQPPLPSAVKIVEKLRTIKPDQINFIYKNFIAIYQPIFVRYFPEFCNLFGFRKMEELLKLSVKDCERYGRHDFYKFIYLGLMTCGKSDVEALIELADLIDVCEESLTAMKEIKSLYQSKK